MDRPQNCMVEGNTIEKDRCSMDIYYYQLVKHVKLKVNTHHNTFCQSQGARAEPCMVPAD